MAQQTEQSSYTQGYSNRTLATQQMRTAETDATFLLPHIKKTDRILDVGCGPGTITTSLAKYASEGSITGIDISVAVLQKAKAVAIEANVSTEGPGSVAFHEGNILEGLSYPDNTFDIIYSSQLLGHLPPPDLPIQALVEMRRLLKQGGILAVRDGAHQHFYPPSLGLDNLWVRNQGRALLKGALDVDPTGTILPALFRRAGFDAGAGKVLIGGGTTVFQGPEIRKWLAIRAASQLHPGDAVHQSWLEAGITEDEIQQTLLAVKKWAETEDAWYGVLQCEMLAWK
jgi:ubiquinone/menaquinone biosynthesis C-methylase UbiE